jgi:hypothetical protein
MLLKIELFCLFLLGFCVVVVPMMYFAYADHLLLMIREKLFQN